jgi:hypothetical protein
VIAEREADLAQLESTVRTLSNLGPLEGSAELPSGSPPLAETESAA